MRYDTLDYELSDMVCRTIYTSAHNQTEKVEDIMKVISDKMDTNVMINKLKEKSGEHNVLQNMLKLR